MSIRYNNLLDNIIIEFDKALRTIVCKSNTVARAIPGNNVSEATLTLAEQRLSIRLMRVNHSGEVAAQAVYQGQALTAKLPKIKQAMEQAALEETDHLIWCEQLVKDLGGHTSILNPLWYAGSFAMGAVAGKIGDEWSLGFVAETERQVVKHLDWHLQKISPDDLKSRAVLEQMRLDELHHGVIALEAGGRILPEPVKLIMGLMSKIMTTSSYWI